MAIRAGAHLGPYEITSLIGAGGMGEVYQAHDTKLDRDVAIKVLPEQFARHPERLARFQREAKMLAALNHPNIAAIYWLDESNGRHYLVMELVLGDTLAQRVKRGPVPIEEALTITRQIAEALEAAHNSEKGIIHRDLKPANVKVTPEGKVKVLDFGLAKAFSPEVSNEDFSNSPTLSMAATQQGVILGTAAYMSPEQARGKEVDKRADIWAFGCVLYEMLSGRTAFIGETLTDTLAAIVGREPDWARLPETTPFVIRRLLQRCLEKETSRRLRDIGDAQIEIDECLSAAPASEPARKAAPVETPARRWLVALAALAAAAVACMAVILVVRLRTTPLAGPSPNVIATRLTNYGGSEAGGVLSPDGRSFAFVSDHGGTPDIWLRQVSGGEPVRLTNDAAEEADLAYAPDGETIVYTRIDAAGTAIWRIGALGGQPQKLLDNAQKPAPSHDGRYLAYLPSAVPAADGTGWVIAVKNLSGGDPQTLVRGIPPGFGAPRPAWSPDGRWLAYTAGGLFGPDGVYLVEVKTGKQRQVIQLPAGSNDSGQPAWLPDSRHMVVPYVPLSRQLGATDLGILDVESGSIARLTTTVADGFITPSVSADGSRLMVTSIQHLSEVWKVPLGPDPDANGRAAVRLLDSSVAPMWTFVSRDGRTLLFNSLMTGSRNLWIMPVQGGAPPRQITAMPGDAVSHSSLSPDGTHVAFASIASGHSDIWTENVDGSDLRQITNDEPADSWPVWSPDGRWIVFSSQRGARQETWRAPSAGGPAEKLADGFFRGDWINQSNGPGTWLISSDGYGRIRLLDVDRRAVLWDEQNAGGGPSFPMFSPDAKLVSAAFREARDHDVIRIFDVSTGKSRVAVRLPFHVNFRASWVDDGRAFVVTKNDAVTHIVLFDDFWTK